MNSSEKTIGVFGGTFDPVHDGHLAIARSFMDSGLIDELWVLLSPYPPHKKENGFASYALRLKMLQQVFESNPNIMVSDLELHLPKPSYTVQTVEYLTKSHPGYSFYLCLGKDSFYSFTSWNRWEDILDYCRLLVADRPVSEKRNLPEKLVRHSQFINHDALAISSSEIRKKIRNKESVNDLLPQSVLHIIEEENLYRNT